MRSGFLKKIMAGTMVSMCMATLAVGVVKAEENSGVQPLIDASQNYTVNADTTSSKRSNNLSKDNNALTAVLTVEKGIAQGYQTVYVWVQSEYGKYRTDSKTCTYNSTTQYSLPYYNVSVSDISDMKKQNFYVYAQVDPSSRTTTASIQGCATP